MSPTKKGGKKKKEKKKKEQLHACGDHDDHFHNKIVQRKTSLP
jgi:hypothetical protein